MAAASAQRLWTAEEFGDRPDPGYPDELVRRRTKRTPPPMPRHGEICANMAFHLLAYLGAVCNWVAHVQPRVVDDESPRPAGEPPPTPPDYRGRVQRPPCTQGGYRGVLERDGVCTPNENRSKEQELGRVLTNDIGVVTERGPDTVRGADVAYDSDGRVPKWPLPNQYLDAAPELIVDDLSPSDRGADGFAKVAEYLRAGVSFVLLLDDKRRVARLFDADGAARALGPEDDLTIPELHPDFRVNVQEDCKVTTLTRISRRAGGVQWHLL